MIELEQDDTVHIVKLPYANGNMPRSEKEKQVIIKRAAKAYEKYMDALGFDWRNDPNSDNTPMRVAKAFVNDIAAGCYSEPPVITAFPNTGYDGIVAQCNIPIASLCGHHHQNITGVAHVAYIPSPDGKVIGLSKLNRIVEFYARRPTIQEGLVFDIHKAINTACEGNFGVAVLIKASHSCVSCRGVKALGCSMITSKLSGDFLEDEKTRTEFYNFIAMAVK